MLIEVGEPWSGALAAHHAIEPLSLRPRLGSLGAFISACIDIAVYPNDGTSAEQLLLRAHLAMYKAKRSGRSQFTCFEARMSAEVNRHAAAQARFRADRRRNAGRGRDSRRRLSPRAYREHDPTGLDGPAGQDGL